MSTIEQAYRYISTVDGVRSGRAVVAGTRIAVHDVIGLILNGASVDDVAQSFPLLTRSQVYECLAYYEDHKAEIDYTAGRANGGARNVRFPLDQDVPAEIGSVLAHAGHEVVYVRDVLAVSAADDEVLEYAVEHGLVLASCNRDDFQARGA